MDSLVDGEVRELLADVQTTAQSVTRVSDEINGIVGDARQPIADFSAEGLYEISGLITDMRQLMGSLSRLTGQLESDPAQFLFGGSQEGFETQ